MREIVHIHGSQFFNKILLKFWKVISDEYVMDPAGTFQDFLDKFKLERFNVYVTKEPVDPSNEIREEPRAHDFSTDGRLKCLSSSL
jgi:hypothetical protein